MTIMFTARTGAGSVHPLSIAHRLDSHIGLFEALADLCNKETVQ